LVDQIKSYETGATDSEPVCRAYMVQNSYLLPAMGLHGVSIQSSCPRSLYVLPQHVRPHEWQRSAEAACTRYATVRCGIVGYKLETGAPRFSYPSRLGSAVEMTTLRSPAAG
jgi:hypothetical protein